MGEPVSVSAMYRVIVWLSTLVFFFFLFFFFLFFFFLFFVSLHTSFPSLSLLCVSLCLCVCDSLSLSVCVLLRVVIVSRVYQLCWLGLGLYLGLGLDFGLGLSQYSAYLCRWDGMICLVTV